MQVRRRPTRQPTHRWSSTARRLELLSLTVDGLPWPASQYTVSGNTA